MFTCYLLFLWMFTFSGNYIIPIEKILAVDKKKLEITPNEFKGSDAERIQLAVNKAKGTGKVIRIPAENANGSARWRSEEHTSELQSRENLVCRLLLEKKKKKQT